MAKLEYQEKDGKVCCPLVNKWLVAKPEEKVRQRYICTLVNDYGYSLDQMAQELKGNQLHKCNKMKKRPCRGISTLTWSFFKLSRLKKVGLNLLVLANS